MNVTICIDNVDPMLLRKQYHDLLSARTVLAGGSAQHPLDGLIELLEAIFEQNPGHFPMSENTQDLGVAIQKHEHVMITNGENYNLYDRIGEIVLENARYSECFSKLVGIYGSVEIAFAATQKADIIYFWRYQRNP